MDEFKIIFWIIVGLIYLFSRGRKKNAPPPRRVQRPDSEPPAPEKTLTFDELLREIESMKQPKPAPQPEPAVLDYEEEPVRDEQPVEDTKYDYRQQDRIYEVYEKAKAEAFERPSLEETVKLKDTIVRFSQFRGYEKAPRPKTKDEYLAILRDKDNFRKAFVVSEILKRKF